MNRESLSHAGVQKSAVWRPPVMIISFTAPVASLAADIEHTNETAAGRSQCVATRAIIFCLLLELYQLWNQ